MMKSLSPYSKTQNWNKTASFLRRVLQVAASSWRRLQSSAEAGPGSQCKQVIVGKKGQQIINASQQGDEKVLKLSVWLGKLE